jgi:hypothetical protein
MKGETMKESNVINFPNGAKIFGSTLNIVAEVMTITPTDAANWLRCNKSNRPLRKSHIRFLAGEIESGNWQVNGQAIVIADNEEVLDGQHRLHAIIEAGKPVQSLVIYGITPEAFRTIDTGIVRTGADALFLHFTESNHAVIKAAATAVQWVHRLERGTVHNNGKLSNTDVIEYVTNHMTLLHCAETLFGYPKETRPLSVGCGTALYEMFNRKDEAGASRFMRRFYTGEELVRTDPEFLLRNEFLKDSQRTAKYPAAIRMRMCIKGWNWLRRGNCEASPNTIAIQANDAPKIVIF